MKDQTFQCISEDVILGKNVKTYKFVNLQNRSVCRWSWYFMFIYYCNEMKLFKLNDYDHTGYESARMIENINSK